MTQNYGATERKMKFSSISLPFRFTCPWTSALAQEEMLFVKIIYSKFCMYRCNCILLGSSNRLAFAIWMIPTRSILDVTIFYSLFKSASMRRPGRTRQGVIMLKSPISLKLGTNVRYQELAYVTECQVKILNSLGDPGSPCKNRHFARFMHN